MHVMILSMVLGALCQTPLNDDGELQSVLSRAAGSGQPHLVALAQRISQIIEFDPPSDPAVFKEGAMRVFRHADTRQHQVADMYLLLTQQQVVNDILEDQQVANSIVIDGASKDWPASALIDFPKQEPAAQLRRFGAVRGNALHLLYETAYMVVDEPRFVYGLEISTLENRFSGTDYLVRISSAITRAYDAAGNEIEAPPDSPISVKAGPKTVEVAIPRHNIQQDMRSVAVRGVIFGPGDQRLIETPWIACPTGPVTLPLQLLIEFAVARDLQANNTLPLAIALQEGLLLTRCHPDIVDAVRTDATAWYTLAADLDARADLGSFLPPSGLPPAAQLAWACRYDGHAALDSKDAYLFHVPTAETLKELGTQGRREGYAVDTDVPGALARITAALNDFEVYDWPSVTARAQGMEWVDDREDAYIARGDNKLLCYRDIGINERHTLHQLGAPLKGSRNQAVAFQRALCQALGLPTLTARYAAGNVAVDFTLSLDGSKKKWLAAGAIPPPETHPHYLLSWSTPWSRPERFAFWHDAAARLPDGDCRMLLDAYAAEQPGKRLTSMLEKGIPHKMIDRTITPN